MNNLKIFKNDEFGEVRSVVIDGNPWFVAADVCNCFGVTNRNRAMQGIDPEDRGGYANEYTWGTAKFRDYK